MVKAPTGMDLSLAGIGTDENSPVNNLQVKALLENTTEDIGVLYPRHDILAEEGFLPSGHEELDSEDFVATLDQLTEIITENLDEILMSSETIYQTAFGSFLNINEMAWEDHFGETPPGPLESWEPVWALGRDRFIITYQQNADSHREHSHSIDEFKYIFHDTHTHILPLRITPALALSEVGTMSLLQAQAFILHLWGYDTSVIAEMLDKPDGTTSSHLNRGKKKSRQAVWMGKFIAETKDIRPPDYLHTINRVGNVYKTETGKLWRITDLVNDDSELVYEMVAEDTEKTVTVDEFNDTSNFYTEQSIDDAPERLRKADVPDNKEFTQDGSILEPSDQSRVE